MLASKASVSGSGTRGPGRDAGALASLAARVCLEMQAGTGGEAKSGWCREHPRGPAYKPEVYVFSFIFF